MQKGDYIRMNGMRKFWAYIATLAVIGVLTGVDALESEHAEGVIRVTIWAFIVGNGTEWGCKAWLSSKSST